MQFWIDEGYLTDLPETSSRWDTITGWMPGQSHSSGPAKLFWYRAGCKSEEQVSEWKSWSIAHPDLASQLWPAVIELLRQAATAANPYEPYLFAGELMRHVRGCNDQEEFQKQLREWRQLCEWLKE